MLGWSSTVAAGRSEAPRAQPSLGVFNLGDHTSRPTRWSTIIVTVLAVLILGLLFRFTAARSPDARGGGEPADGRARGRRLRARRASSPGCSRACSPASPACSSRRCTSELDPQHLPAAHHRRDRGGRGRAVHEHPVDAGRRPAHRGRSSGRCRTSSARRAPSPPTSRPRSRSWCCSCCSSSGRSSRERREVDRPARGRRPAATCDGARVQGRSAPAALADRVPGLHDRVPRRDDDAGEPGMGRRASPMPSCSRSIFLSITIFTGLGGQISLMQATFAAAGGFALAQRRRGARHPGAARR